MCNFIQKQLDDFDWTRHQGSTSSASTGPSSDHTGNGYYMYIETSSPRQKGDKAGLISPLWRFSGNMCFQFYYHMYGSTIGSLNVTINNKQVFSASGNKGSKWLKADINVNLSGMYTVEFEGTTGSSFTGDIAIDDVSLSPGMCSSNKLENVQLTTSAASNKACQGDIIIFNCSAEAYPSVTSYQLFENNTAILEANRLGIWSRKLTNGGVFHYKCVANNSIGSVYSKSVTLNVPASIVPFKNVTVEKGKSITLVCNVSGAPKPSVSWTQVSTGKKRSDTIWILTDFQESDAGEYRCDAINNCNNSKSIFISLDVNKCTVECTDGRTCREFGKYICLCSKGKKGRNCEEYDIVANTVVVSFEIKNKEWREEFKDLSALETQVFVGIIIRSVDEELKGSGMKNINVTKLRKGSVIADVILTFNEPVGESEVESLLSVVLNDGSLGTLSVDTVAVGYTIPVLVPVPSEPANVNKDVIYGSVIGVLALICVVSIIIFLARKRRKRQRDHRDDAITAEPRGSHLNETFELDGTNENVNANAYHGPRHYMGLGEVRSDETANTDTSRIYLEINEYAPLHPGTRLWEVASENVIIEKVIGRGAFGQVAQGKVLNIRGREETTTAAIKMLKGDATDSDRKDLMSELEVMKKLKPHPHVIKLLGCVTESDPLLVIIEYVPYGDLRGYLRKSRHLEDNYYNDPDVKPQTSLTSQQLTKFSWQVADGMHYLSSKNIIHRDLAARNILVGEGERCKVTDFGMARDVCQENIYERKSQGRLPVKWTAYEGLLFGRYTTKSDVWSFGIVLYEIFTIGGSPYPRTEGRKMADLLCRGYRMPKPRHVDDSLYKIMQDCWQENPGDRPTFENLREGLKEMENQHQMLINMQYYENKLYENVD